MDIRLIALVFTVAVNLLLAALVYRNNRKSSTNIIFGALSIVTSLWLIVNYFSVTETFFDNSLLWVKLSIFFAAPQILLFFLLSHTIPSEKILLSRFKLRILLLVTVLLMMVALSPFSFTSTEIVNGSVEATVGPGMPVFGIFAISMSIGAVTVLIKKMKHSTGYVREQLQYVVGGLVSMLGLLILTVLIPVAVLKNSTFVPLIPLYTIIFLGATTYAIIKKKLFDVRAVVAKSVAYLLVLLTLATLYGVIAFQVSNLFFDTSKIGRTQKILNVVVALVLAFSLHPLKRFFERLTDRIFYRDKYDPQALLNDVSKVLAAEIELNKLTDDVCKLVKTHMRLSSANIVVLEKSHIIYGEENLKPRDEKPVQDLSTLGKSHIFVDDISEGQTKHFMDNLGLRASIPLHTREEFVGYFLLGEKLNGEAYNKEDERVLVILAAELAVAISNAKAYLEIKQFNVTLQKKVDDATAELRRANEKLRELDETKDEFISMASHQLRTPLTSVKGYVSMVLEGDAGKITANQKKLLDQSFLSAQRMVYLIADLLNVSRLRTGKFIIDAAPTNLADLVEGEIEQLNESAKSRNLTLTYEKPKDFPILMLDETKIRQVVMNFADNAIYYTPSGGHITINLADKGESIEFTVVDDGIGVPKHLQHHLFGKFYRADNAKKARPDGTGLGLFMAKKVVVAQGGAIVFKSEEGKGSTFGFSFNKDKLKVPPHKKIDAKEVSQKSKEPSLM